MMAEEVRKQIEKIEEVLEQKAKREMELKESLKGYLLAHRDEWKAVSALRATNSPVKDYNLDHLIELSHSFPEVFPATSSESDYTEVIFEGIKFKNYIKKGTDEEIRKTVDSFIASASKESSDDKIVQKAKEIKQLGREIYELTLKKNELIIQYVNAHPQLREIKEYIVAKANRKSIEPPVNNEVIQKFVGKEIEGYQFNTPNDIIDYIYTLASQDIGLRATEIIVYEVVSDLEKNAKDIENEAEITEEEIREIRERIEKLRKSDIPLYRELADDLEKELEEYLKKRKK